MYITKLVRATGLYVFLMQNDKMPFLGRMYALNIA